MTAPMIRGTNGRLVFNIARDLVAYGAKLKGWSYAEITERRRDRPYAHSRFAIAWVMRHYLNYPYKRIAAELGFKNYTSAFHAVNENEKLMDADPEHARYTEKLIDYASPRSRVA